MNKDIILKAHKEGDIHPNGKLIWRQAANGGRGDWRTIPKSQRGGAQTANNGAAADSKKKDISQFSKDELLAWAKKTNEDVLSKIVNKTDGHKPARQIAYDELVSRGSDVSKLDTSGLKVDNGKKSDSSSSSKTESPKSQSKAKTYDNYKTKKPQVPIHIGKFTVRSTGSGSQKDFTYDEQKARYNKFDDAHIIKFVNAQNMAPENRQVAFDIAYERGIPEDKLNVDGTLKKFWDKQKKLQDDVKTSNNVDDDDETQWQSVDTGLENFEKVTKQSVDEFMEQFPEGDMGWMSEDDDRVQKAFNNLKTPSDRRLYDNFIDAQKRKNPKYVNQKMQLNRLRKSYFSFLSKNNQRPMLVSMGGAGVGKTWNFNHMAQDYCGMVKWDSEKAKAADEAGQEYTDFDYIVAPQINSVPKLCKFLSKYKNKVVVFDDNDAILTDNEMSNIMKTLCDGTPSNRYFAEYDDKGKATGKNAIFSGKIVVMTNKSSDKLQRNKDANAVMSRAAQNEVSFTINENIEALKDRYMTMDCNINIPSFDDAKEKQLRKDIFDYIVDNKDKLDPRSFTVRKFAALYEKAAEEINAAEAASQSASAADDMTPEDWRESALDILNKGENNEPLNVNMAFHDPEDDLTEEEKRKFAKIFKKIDTDDGWEFNETSGDEKEDAADDKVTSKKKTKKKKIKKAVDIDLGMSLSEAENLLLG
nr:MAG TPA: ATPase [Caudoviricetes sp.]